MSTVQPLRLGLRANLAQFSLLVAVNALVGGMVGQEQTVLPLLAEREFHLVGYGADRVHRARRPHGHTLLHDRPAA